MDHSHLSFLIKLMVWSFILIFYYYYLFISNLDASVISSKGTDGCLHSPLMQVELFSGFSQLFWWRDHPTSLVVILPTSFSFLCIMLEFFCCSFNLFFWVIFSFILFQVRWVGSLFVKEIGSWNCVIGKSVINNAALH